MTNGTFSSTTYHLPKNTSRSFPSGAATAQGQPVKLVAVKHLSNEIYDVTSTC